VSDAILRRIRPEQFREVILLVVTVGLLLFFASQIPNYFDPRSVNRLTTGLAITLVVAVGQVLVVLTRNIDRLGAARCVSISLALMATALLSWPLADNPGAMAGVLLLWGLGIFSCNSAQQARLAHSAPAWAPALLALNTSAIYVGQAIGAAGGGFLLVNGGFTTMSHAALAWMLVALGVSLWAASRMKTVSHA